MKCRAVFRVLKEVVRLITVKYHPQGLERDYSEYWAQRSSEGLNEFQKFRLQTLLSCFSEEDTVIDLGSGRGEMLRWMADRYTGRFINADLVELDDDEATQVQFISVDLGSDQWSTKVPAANIICIFEVLEHLPNAEDVLVDAVRKSDSSVLISVPNTGYLPYRLRLLFGSFPVQWRSHPAEHLRFWTCRDLKLWIDWVLPGYEYEITPYEGIYRFLQFWPELLAAGLVVKIKTGKS